MGTSSYRPWICTHLGVNLFLVLLNLWVAVPRPVLLDAMGVAPADSVLALGAASGSIVERSLLVFRVG